MRVSVVYWAMRRNHLLAATGVCLALITYATLARFAGQPALLGHGQSYWGIVIERFSAYALLGFLLSFLLPGRITGACVLVLAVAGFLEIFQALMLDQEPHILDVLQKAAGGIVGVFLAQTILAFLPRPPS